MSPGNEPTLVRVLRCAVGLKIFRPRATTALVATVLALLPVLAIAQYRWLGQISENERGRLQRALTNAMSGVARDLDNELAGAVRRLDVESLVSGAASRDGLPASQLVSDVLHVQWPAGHDASLTLNRCDVHARSCSAAEWPADFGDLRQAIVQVARRGSYRDAESLSRSIRTARGSQSVVVLPLGDFHGHRWNDAREWDAHDHASDLTGVALVLLDDRWLRRELVPRIVERYFGSASESEFRVTIVTRGVPVDVVYADRNTTPSDAVMRPDVRQDLFALRAVLSRDRWSRTGGEGDEWVMVARHRSGSLQKAVDDVQRRNLLVAFGILSLMGIAVGLIAVTTRRAHRLAEQQIEFVAGVSHELRTPVSAIYLAAQNLADGTVTDASRIRRYGATIQTESQRLRETVERVLQFAAINDGQPIGSRIGVDIRALVEDVAASARAERADAEIQVTAAAGLPTILGDPLALRACVQNIVANALKYGGRPPQVHIAISVDVHRHQPALRISCEDNGPGIPAGEREHVFEPFFRGRAALEQRVQGSGLGLHLVKRLVMAHGGHVDLLASVHKGATIVIHLPIGLGGDSPVRGGSSEAGAFTAPDGIDFRHV